jgi:hypothetical protein
MNGECCKDNNCCNKEVNPDELDENMLSEKMSE